MTTQSPMAPGSVPMTLQEAVAKDLYVAFLTHRWFRTEYERPKHGETLALSAWEYAETWMRIRGRQSFLPKIHHPAPGQTLSDLWPVVESLAAIRFEQPLNTPLVAELIVRARGMIERRNIIAAACERDPDDTLRDMLTEVDPVNAESGYLPELPSRAGLIAFVGIVQRMRLKQCSSQIPHEIRKAEEFVDDCLSQLLAHLPKPHGLDVRGEVVEEGGGL